MGQVEIEHKRGAVKMELSDFSKLKINTDLAGKRIVFSAVVTQSELKDMKGGGKYLMLKVRDKGNEEVAKLWNAEQEDADTLKVGGIYDFAMDVKPYAASPTGVSLIVHSYQVSQADPAKFIEWAPDVQVRAQEILDFVQGIQGTTYGTLAATLLSKNWTQFVRLPAGKNMHHTEAGGLVWHTASVAGICQRQYEHYEKMYGHGMLNRPLLIAGAVLHDIGKVQELSLGDTGLTTEYTQDSLFGSHLLIGVRMIEQEATRLGIEGSEEVKLLEHMVASHHGTVEYGALALPVIPEALILSQADLVDASMWRQAKAMRTLGAGESNTVWFRNQPMSYYKDSGKTEYPAKEVETQIDLQGAGATAGMAAGAPAGTTAGASGTSGVNGGQATGTPVSI